VELSWRTQPKVVILDIRISRVEGTVDDSGYMGIHYILFFPQVVV